MSLTAPVTASLPTHDLSAWSDVELEMRLDALCSLAEGPRAFGGHAAYWAALKNTYCGCGDDEDGSRCVIDSITRIEIEMGARA